MNKISSDLGGMPELAWIDVDLIFVDRNYQREIKSRLVEKILKNFRWDHFGAVVLARQENGTFHVTDGQHRVKAAKLHPSISKVPALVTAGTGMQTEAVNFLAINRDRQAVTPVERYWAGLSAGDADCLALAAVLKRAGCDVVPEAGCLAPNCTSAVSAVGRAVKRYGGEHVEAALLILRSAWPNDPHALRGTLISAVTRLCANNGHLDADRMVAVLRPMSFASMTAAAEGFRKLSGGSAETALAKTMAELYNKGLSRNTIFFGAAG